MRTSRYRGNRDSSTGSNPVGLGEHSRRLLFVERDGALERPRSDARGDLHRVDARVAEQRGDLLEIVVPSYDS